MVKSNNQGFTLIELVIAMGISSIVLSIVLGISFTGGKTFGNIFENTEIQQQGHFIMDSMSNSIMSSRSVRGLLSYEGQYLYESNDRVEVGILKLNDDSLQEGETHIFSIQKDPKVEGKSLRYGKTGKAKIETGNYIKAIYIEPLPKECSYKDAKGLYLSIEMEKGKSTIVISKNIYFRNQ